MQQNNSNRNAQGSVSAALSAVRAEANANFPLPHPSSSNGSSARMASSLRFPGEDGGRSLAEMAHRDLDAALQLLADRAQYITGATGAAIALRRDGKNDMLCRASSGSNAPELGALLSTEFGLSGESVRTKQALRCDDAERDVRVNHEVCRQMGIASVVVMPVVNDDEVLGVFELFSGRANAFGARDVSAVQRLSEMVETAVRLAQAAERLPDQLKVHGTSAPTVPEDQVLDGEVLADVVLQGDVADEPVLEEHEPAVNEVREKAEAGASEANVGDEKKTSIVPDPPLAARRDHARTTEMTDPGMPIEGSSTAAIDVKNSVPGVEAISVGMSRAGASRTPQAEAVAPKKRLFWSAAESAAADAGKTEEADRSHVPPVLRGLRKCEACGFPISAGRTLCVECDEKKFKGQLKMPQAGSRPAAPTTPTTEKASQGTAGNKVLTNATSSIAELDALRRSSAASASPVAAGPVDAKAFAAAANAPTAMAQPVAAPMPFGVVAASGAEKGSKIAPSPTSNAPATQSRDAVADATQDFVLSAGLAPSQSWLAANKYMVGVLLAVVLAILAVFVLR